MGDPRVTVLMSAYNAGRYVGEAVDSVLKQTFVDFEFLIFEDKSTDETLKILRGCEDPRILLIKNHENMGLTKNLAAGMELARGEYVARFDADDCCELNRLERQVAFLDAHPEIGLLGSAVTFFNDNGWEMIAHQPLTHEEIKCVLFYGYTMLHPTVMMRKAAFAQHGLNYDTTFRVSQDHDLWVRAIRKIRFANLYEPLVRMREHSGKIGSTSNGLQRAYSDRVRERQLKELGLVAESGDLRLLGEHETSVDHWVRENIEGFESLLLRIFHANQQVQIYDQEILITMGAARFRELCRRIFLVGNRTGRYYWRSRLRHLDEPTVRQLAGLAFRMITVGFR